MIPGYYNQQQSWVKTTLLFSTLLLENIFMRLKIWLRQDKTNTFGKYNPWELEEIKDSFGLSHKTAIYVCQIPKDL